MTDLSIVRGTNDKPAATQSLIEAFGRLDDVGGQLFIGYPIVGSADGRHPIHAVYVSPRSGVVVFDLVEGALGDYEERQDEAATRLQQRLLGYRDLVSRRNLQVAITSVTYSPGLPERNVAVDDEYRRVNETSLPAALASIEWPEASDELYQRTLSAIQNISTIRRAKTPRQIEKSTSRGAILQQLEDSIATLDNLQSKAVIETVDGVQRIRGLAGSGKTIVLALKAAYLHAQHPEWRIAITFNTRSLKAQFHRLINSFTIESTGDEPNWLNVRIVNSWGAPGGGSRDGLFYEFCVANGATYRDFGSASNEFGRDNAFNMACLAAIDEVRNPRPLYDAILVDEAQDLPPSFLRICYSMLDEKKRLVYAYDELQNLSGQGVPSAEEIFGRDDNGTARVTFETSSYDLGARRDIVLEKCYRNSRPVLVSAHGLGFGIYRQPTRSDAIGLVQMFEQPSLWTDIGYHVDQGELEPGAHVKLSRTDETSPAFLETHSALDDLVQFITFPSQSEQNEWVANQIQINLQQDELRYDDIVVINTDPIRTRTNVGPIRRLLLERGIQNHLAGVDTVADVFFNPDKDSITFTGIYRAKGNEAGMVYIVNSEEAQTSAANLARVRNRLFTAITRSKAWVRVLGVGPRMVQLQAEYEQIREHQFSLEFDYPTRDQLKTIQVIHRDVPAGEEARINKRKARAETFLQDLETGQLYREDIDPDVLERLYRMLRGSEDQ